MFVIKKVNSKDKNIFELINELWNNNNLILKIKQELKSFCLFNAVSL